MSHRRFVVTAACVALIVSCVGFAEAQKCMPCSLEAKHNLGSGGFIGEEGILKLNLEFSGLKPSTTYIMSVNGKPDKRGNDLLIKQCGEYESTKMGVCDFAEATSDKEGKLVYTGSISLPKGNYDVKFLLKEKMNNYCSVFCYDYLRFSIK